MYDIYIFFSKLYVIQLKNHFRLMREWRSILFGKTSSSSMTEDQEKLLCRSFGDFEK